MKDLETKPGPANYEPDYRKIYSSNPSFSMPRKYKPMNPDPVPGPNAVFFKSYLVLNQIYANQYVYTFWQIKETTIFKQ